MRAPAPAGHPPPAPADHDRDRARGRDPRRAARPLPLDDRRRRAAAPVSRTLDRSARDPGGAPPASLWTRPVRGSAPRIGRAASPRPGPHAVTGILGGPMQYVAEHFTSDEQDILRPYFTNVDGPVFALVNLPEVVKGALFARYSRSDKSLRRLFLDEFVGTLDITGDLIDRRERRAEARRGALRPRVPRVRRRLRRAARRRAPRVRAGVEPAHQGARVGSAHGVPRAVDALHRVRQPPRRSVPVPAPARGARVAARRRATSASSTRCSRATPTASPRCSTGPASATRRSRATPTSSTSRRSRPRPATRCAACCRRRRCRTSASTAPGRATSSCCCACGRTRCPRPAATRT